MMLNSESWKTLQTKNGTQLGELSKQSAVLVFFLRHSGCTFCRETLAELQANKKWIKPNTKVLIVHMGDEQSGQKLAEEYDLKEHEFVSDPKKAWYKAFGLRRGSLNELFGPKVWVRGLVAGVIKGHGVGALEGDGLQMGGIFALQNNSAKQIHDPCHAGDIGDLKTYLAQSI